jgi:poly-gamma-glutamate synthesis protein (capsule biosynthesis protein)
VVTLGVALAVMSVLAAGCAGSGSAAAPPGTDASGRPLPASDDGNSPPPTTAFVPRHFTLAASGDILLHNLVIQDGKANAGGKGYNFDPMFDGVRDLITSADVAICHQETPISADDTNLTVPNTLSFNAPHEIATALKNAGFDGCDTASNHTWDRQLKGVNDTLNVLDAAGLKHAGSTRNQQEADMPGAIYDVKGVKVGHLAYSYDIYNTGGPDTKVPPEAPWLKSMLWPVLGAQGIIDQAKALKARGAEFIVVSIHWGDEYVRMPTAQQRQLAKDLLSSPDIDLILGDHVHVVQPCEKINDKYVEYGMGNFLSNQSPTQDKTLKLDNQDGSLDTYTIDEVSPGVFKTTKMVYTPTWVIIPGHKIVQATPDKYKDSYNRTVQAMGSLGPGVCDATPAF